MYLTKRHYVKNWDYQKPEEKHYVTVKKNNKIRKDINRNKISYVIEEVMYWRKANAIHRWFVDNIQEGDDNCQESYFEKDQLKILLETINKVLENNKLAEELLPVQEGFFFGDTEYNEYYFQDLKDTKEMIEKELSIQNSNAEYYYRASW